MILSHKNTAILSTADKKIEEYISQVKYRAQPAKHQSFQPPQKPKITSNPYPKTNDAPVSAPQTVKLPDTSDQVHVSVKLLDGSKQVVQSNRGDSIKKLLRRVSPSLSPSNIHVKVRHPKPKRTIHVADETVDSIAQGDSRLELALLPK